MSREQLIEEISRETHIRREVVTQVLDEFRNIAIEEIIQHHNFPLPGIFTVKPHVTAEKKMPGGAIAPARKSFRLAASDNLKDLYRLQHTLFPHRPGMVSRDTWQGAVKWAKTKKA